ncbi:sensor histidine kinase [Nitrosophilus kaiyonis]|uniref:sensor histidine kinase n=1 Tax=Nitrosophilus kaiyonis TaxID=2930200 RepID=UPI00248FEC35|nr:HAMP domain-containing sensor histidine kinase [Nitrosophilus kaiyonis]
MLPSEKKTLINFLSLYIFLTLIILSLVSFMYYDFQKNLMFSQIRPKLTEYAKDVIHRLKEMHQSLGEDLHYPRYSRFKSAIYDADYIKIFSLLENENVNLNKVIYKTGRKIHFIKEPDAYYLGTKYVIIEVDDNELWLKKVYKNIFIFGLFFIVFMGFIGYFLTKLFLKPMHNSLILLDNFIKDTTHELNTPISAILANIETIDKQNLDKKLKKKINRIEIAARTISNIYQDLTYLIMHKKIKSKIEKINLKDLILQRVSYFKILAQSKKIDFILDLQDSFLEADKKKISKMIDNIISNAIKYNRVGGKIKIALRKNYISILDTGIGIPKEKIKDIFKRYQRFNSSEGGFGIGLNIVYMIANEFHLKIEIDSEINKGTEVIIKW